MDRSVTTAFAQELPRDGWPVIGSSSTGGDTAQNSAIMADTFFEHLGVDKVDPVGASKVAKAL